MPTNVPTSFDPSLKASSLQLADPADYRVLTATARGMALSRTKASTGKWYVEWDLSAGVGSWMPGIAAGDEILTLYTGQSNKSIGIYQGAVYRNGSTVASSGALNAAGQLGMAIDADARTVRFFNASGDTGDVTIPWAGDIYLAGGADSIMTTPMVINPAFDTFAFAVPSGFTPGFALRSAYVLAGTVTDASGAAAVRSLRAHHRASGVLVGRAKSDSSGNFVLTPEPSNNTDVLYAVALPDSTSENALIFDRVTPE